MHNINIYVLIHNVFGILHCQNGTKYSIVIPEHKNVLGSVMKVFFSTQTISKMKLCMIRKITILVSLLVVKKHIVTLQNF